MGPIYWLLPLFALAVLIAVLPVLIGTMRHEHWERNHLALQEQQLAELSGEGSVTHSGVSEDSLRESLERAKSDAVELVRRIEHLTERVDGQTVTN
jgi:hypothetical protein